MKKIIFSGILSFASTFFLAQSYHWSTSLGSPVGEDAAGTIVADSMGNVYSAGRFSDSIRTENNTIWTHSEGNYDCYLSKQDPGGNFSWIAAFGSSGFDAITKIACDRLQNTYVVGYFSDTMHLMINGNSQTYVSQEQGNNADIFAGKFDPSGNIVWFHVLGNTYSETIISLTLDADDNVYLGGGFRGTLDFDPSPAVNELTSASGGIFISKMNSSGELIWVKKVDGNADMNVSDLQVDLNGDIILSGQASVTVDFDPGPDTFYLSPAGQNAYILKIDAEGNFIWADLVRSDGFVYVQNIKIDHSNNMLISGVVAGSSMMIYGADTLNFVSDELEDIFLLKLSDNGTFSWGKHLEGSGTELSSSIEVDSLNAIYHSGFIINSIVDMNPDDSLENLIGTGTICSFISKLDSNGIFCGVKKITSFTSCYMHATYLDKNMNLYGTGSFSGEAHLDLDNPGVTTDVSGQSYDAFVVKWSLLFSKA